MDRAYAYHLPHNRILLGRGSHYNSSYNRHLNDQTTRDAGPNPQIAQCVCLAAVQVSTPIGYRWAAWAVDMFYKFSRALTANTNDLLAVRWPVYPWLVHENSGATERSRTETARLAKRISDCLHHARRKADALAAVNNARVFADVLAVHAVPRCLPCLRRDTLHSLPFVHTQLQRRELGLHLVRLEQHRRVALRR